MAEIISVEDLLEMNLDIPYYQRPYKWDTQNINNLILDIATAINDAAKYGNEFKYRLGTIILHKEGNTYNIVDGQQRFISLILLKLYIKPDTEPEFNCPILGKKINNKITQYNIHRNYAFIKEWFSLKNAAVKEAFNLAFKNILETVVIYVDNVDDAFQLFDSQNTRGKTLDPHDLLKAYHLREMRQCPYEMEHAVTKWEAKDTEEIKNLFDLYLFPIWNWSRGNKSKPFTSKEIDIYKGITEGSTYSYAKRASKAMPHFQITEPFIAGNDFFEMVEHYMRLLKDIKSEICYNSNFGEIKQIICGEKKVDNPDEMDRVKLGSAGLRYVKNLFFCALLCYYDRFHNFDEMVVKKLFSWAFMLRADMDRLGFDSVNKYAIGEENSNYTNNVGMFSKICLARMHHDIAGLPIKVLRNPDYPSDKKWKSLYDKIKEINGYGGQNE